MNIPVQSVSLMSNPISLEAKSFPIGSVQQALALQPSLASQAFQTMGGGAALSAMSLTSSPATLNPLSGSKNHSDAQLKEVSKNFEAIFMRMLFKEMRNSVQKSGVMGNSQALEFFETMRDEQLSDHWAAQGGLGIGNVIYQKLKEVTLPHQKSFR